MSNSSATCRCWCSCSSGSSCCRNCCRAAAGLWLKQMPNAPFYTAAIGDRPVHVGARRRAAARRHRLAAARAETGRDRARTDHGAGLSLRAAADGVSHHPAAADVRVSQHHQEYLGRHHHRPDRTDRSGARDAGIFVSGVRGLHRRDRAVSPDQHRRRHRHALPRTPAWRSPATLPGSERTYVRQFRLRRHPPLARLPVPRRHDVHADADGLSRARRPDLRHADRADAAVRLQAARPHRRPLCRPDALAAAGAGDLLVLFPGALYRAVADRRVAADPRRRVHLLARHLHHVRGGVFLRDHARRHPVDLRRAAGGGAARSA